MTYTRTRRGRSWHVAAANNLTRCGRNIDPDAETLADLPSGKSCETCLRWVAREVEKQVEGE